MRYEYGINMNDYIRKVAHIDCEKDTYEIL